MKKALISVVFFAVLICSISAENQSGNELTVIVKGIDGNEGRIAIGLFDDEAAWGEETFQGAFVRITTDTVSYIFKNLPQGLFAVAVYHDQNENEELDKGLFGIPKEGYAFSNNVFGSFGPPKFDEASFLLNGKKEIVINMKY